MDKEYQHEEASSPVKLAHHFAQSEKFRELFSSGMALVEETADFLDTDGRESAKRLSKSAASLYGNESMRLTTRLMQLASWLLLQRAVAEGEMTRSQVLTEKQNIKLNQHSAPPMGPGWDEFSPKFIELIENSIALQNRIQHLDREIYGDDDPDEINAANPVASQQALLETAFDRRFK